MGIGSKLHHFKICNCHGYSIPTLQHM